MKFVAFDPFKHLEYARSVLTTSISDATRGIVAIDKDNQPCAIVLLDTWAENSCLGHVAIQNPLALRRLPYELFDYVFNVCGKGMLLGFIPANLGKSYKFNTHLGFEELYRIKDGYADGIDYIVMQILKENCKYINNLDEVA